VQADQVEAFLASIFGTLSDSAAARPERGAVALRSGPSVSSREMTAIVALEGDVIGVLFCSLSVATAAKLHRCLMGDAEVTGGPGRQAALALVRQAAEAGAAHLVERGNECAPTEALVAEGFGEPLTELSPVLVVPVFTDYGDMEIGLVLLPRDALSPGMRLVTASAGRREGRDADDAEFLALAAEPSPPAAAKVSPSPEEPADATPAQDAAEVASPTAPPAGGETSDEAEQAAWEAALSEIEAEEAAAAAPEEPSAPAAEPSPPADPAVPDPAADEPVSDQAPAGEAAAGDAPSLASILAQAQADGKLTPIGSGVPAKAGDAPEAAA
jgi:CheY-specific phosphatase CheX